MYFWELNVVAKSQALPTTHYNMDNNTFDFTQVIDPQLDVQAQNYTPDPTLVQFFNQEAQQENPDYTTEIANDTAIPDYDQNYVQEQYVDEQQAAQVPELTDLSQQYIQSQLNRVADTLAQAGTKEALLQWLPLVFIDNYLPVIQQSVEDSVDIESARNIVVAILHSTWISLADEIAVRTITPWDLSASKDEQLVKLFGERSTTLPVSVVVGANTYNHQLSQDFMFGLLAVLNGNDQFRFFIGESPVTINDISANYTVDDVMINTAYIANIGNVGPVAFRTPETIQGVITAAQWINTDARKLVSDFSGMVNEQRIALVF